MEMLDIDRSNMVEPWLVAFPILKRSIKVRAKAQSEVG
jgi:hypothetical protein